MKVVVQRCQKGQVMVNQKVINEIDQGFVILIGIASDDTLEDMNYLVRKILNLRVFDDEKGVMNLSVKDIKGEVLSVSQFTLYGDTKKGNRPSYILALGGKDANLLYELFNKELQKEINTKTGVFGADMQVALINDGPVTILIEKE